MSETRTLSSTRTPLAVGDLVLAVLVAITTTAIFDSSEGATSFMSLGLGLMGAVLLPGLLWWRNAYVVTRTVRWNGDLSLLVRATLTVTAIMILTTWVFDMRDARLWQVATTLGWLASLTLLRVILARSQPPTAPVRVVVAGGTLDALAVRLALRADPRTSYDVLGFVMDSLHDDVPDVVKNMALGSIDHLPHLARKNGAELVVVCLGAMQAERFALMVRQLNMLGIDVALSTGLGNVALKRVNLGHVSGRPLVRITPAPNGRWHVAVKRTVDVVGAALLLVLASPIMGLTTIAIRLQDRGKAIFTQQRVGKDGKPFTIYKFRTMVDDAEDMLIDLTNDHEGPVFKMKGDPRVTRLGSFLRKTSIDELPQLYNILKGEMSLVGPRPLPIHEVEAAPVSFLDRQAVKPGLTGRWQVSGRADTGFEELDELDRWYVDNWSLGQDLEILARTLPAVLLARGAR